MHPVLSDLFLSFEDLQQERDHLAQALSRFESSPVWHENPIDHWLAVTGIASATESIYTGVERLFKLVASNIDQSVPQGDDHHRQLLQRMTHPLPHTRPPVISQNLRADLDLLRSFRHRERNLYKIHLNASLVIENAQRAVGVVPRLGTELQAFAQQMDPDFEPSEGDTKDSKATRGPGHHNRS